MLNRRKRVYSFWNKQVPQLSLHYQQYKIFEARRLTPIVMRLLGDCLVIIDESDRTIEHCGDLVTGRELRLCDFRRDATLEPKAPAVREVFGYDTPKATKPEPKPVPEPAPKPVVEPEPVAPEAVEAPAEEEAPKPTRKKTTRRSSKKGATKKQASTKKAEAPAEAPKAEDLNPFADSE